MNLRGFVQLPLLLAFVLGMVVVGTGFVAYETGKVSVESPPQETATSTSEAESPSLAKPIESVKAIVQPTPVISPTASSESTTIPAQAAIDSTLIVANCQAKAQTQADQGVALLLQKALPTFQKLSDQAHAKYVEASQEKSSCYQVSADMIGASPSSQQSVIDSCVASKQSTIDYYSKLENQYYNEWEAFKLKTKGEDQKKLYNSYYLACLEQ